MVKKQYHVAVIGCGLAGKRHAQALAACEAKLRWAVDVDLKRAQELREALGVAGSDLRLSLDYHNALEDAEVEVVDICLPHNLHAQVAIEAAARGKHILCEKPIADTLANADQMIAAAEQAGVVLMIAENELYNPLYHKVRDLVQQGMIGVPALVQRTRECYLTRSFLSERRWFLDAQAAAGGVMMAGGVHDFASTCLILGDVASVYALRAPQRFLELEGDDTSVALVRFRNGVVGTFVQSFIMKSLVTAAGPEVHSLRIDGTLGSLAVDDGQTIRLYTEQGDPYLGETLVQHQIVIPPKDTFTSEIEYFLGCLSSGEEPITSGRLQRRPFEIVLAAYESMRTGQPQLLG